MIDDFVWKVRGATFLKNLAQATKELQRNARIIRNDNPINRDVLDPTSASLKKCFEPLSDSLWNECYPGVDPAVHQRIFGMRPKPEAVRAYRIYKARHRKLTAYVRAVEDYCRAGQERFSSAAEKYEIIRLHVCDKLESPPVWATVQYNEQLRRIMDALRDISILTIVEITKANSNTDTGAKPTNGKPARRKHEKCTSRFAGRTIRNLSVSADGVTFTVHRQYAYRITAKQAIEFLDKLIASYEKTNQPVKANFQLASVFKREDAMRFRKRHMVAKHGVVHLNIPN